MTENMKNFLKKVSEDKAMAEKISKLEKEELIAAAKELHARTAAGVGRYDDHAPGEGPVRAGAPVQSA